MPIHFFQNREVIFLIIYGFIAVLSLIGPGTSLGYSSIALPPLTSNNTAIVLNQWEAPLFASLPVLVQIFGALACIVTMKRGRKFAIVTGSLVCTLGWIVVTLSSNIILLFIGRVLTGFSVGLCSTPATIYLGEISTTRWRTILTTSVNCFYCTGIVLVYLFGFLMRDNWRGVAAICILFPAVSAISTIILLPESPTWLLIRNREEEAKNSLFRIRGLRKKTQGFRDEFLEMVNYIETERNRVNPICDIPERTPQVLGFWKKLKQMMNVLLLPEVWKPFLILNSYFFFQQFSGLYVMISYAVDIIENFGITVDPLLITVVLGIIQVIGGIITLIFSAKVDRRFFTIISGVGIAISWMGLGVNAQFFQRNSSTILPLTCVIVFVASGSIGFIVLPWAMIGELYPAQYINVLGPASACLSGIFNFSVVQLYPVMVQYDKIATIYFYCIVAAIGTLFMFLVLPETRGKTRLEIETGFKKTSIFYLIKAK